MNEVIGFACKRLNGPNWEIDGQSVYYERWSWVISVWFKADVRLTSIHDAIAATREAAGNEHLAWYPVGHFLSDMHKRDLDFRNGPEGLYTGRKQRVVVFDCIQDLLIWYILQSMNAVWMSWDRQRAVWVTLLCWSNWPSSYGEECWRGLIVSEIFQFEEGLLTAEAVLEALYMLPVFWWMIAKRVSSASGLAQAQAELQPRWTILASWRLMRRHATKS